MISVCWGSPQSPWSNVHPRKVSLIGFSSNPNKPNHKLAIFILMDLVLYWCTMICNEFFRCADRFIFKRLRKVSGRRAKWEASCRGTNAWGWIQGFQLAFHLINDQMWVEVTQPLLDLVPSFAFDARLCNLHWRLLGLGFCVQIPHRQGFFREEFLELFRPCQRSHGTTKFPFSERETF